MNRWIRVGVLAVLVHVSLCGWVGCKRDNRLCECGTSTEIGPELMAYLSKARAAHGIADVKEQHQDIRGAIDALQQIVLSPRPAGRMVEAEEVLADTLARSSELRSRLGEYEQANKEVEQGLSIAPQDSYFQGHLYEVQGINAERQSKSLASAGDLAGAEKARTAAVQAFEKAVIVQDKVIERSLAADAGSKP